MASGDQYSVADDAAMLDAELYAGMIQGGFQAHAGVDPAEVLARVEDGVYDEENLVRIEALYRLMEYFFADGWEPVALVRRVYCVARECFPGLLAGVDGRDVVAVCDDEVGKRRFGVVYRRLIAGWDAGRLCKWHEKTARYGVLGGRVKRGYAVVMSRVTGVMTDVYARCEGADCEQGVSLVSLLEVPGDDEWDEVRRAVFGELMRVFFADGGDALRVVRRVYAIAKALRPSLIGRMSLESMAWLCGDGGRATQSARVERVYNWLVNEFSASGRVKASFQKSASASEAYRAAQMGNNNRSEKGK